MKHVHKKEKEFIAIPLHCPTCGEMFRNGTVIEERANVCLLHEVCALCAHNCVGLVFKTQVGISSVVLVSDLSHADLVKMRYRVPITSDEVIHLHQFLCRTDAALMLVADRR